VTRPVAVVIGRHWLEPRSELAFATRSLAAAASRCGPVAILVPGDPGRRAADGAFDLRGMGSPGALQWPEELSTETTVIVDELTTDVATLLASTHPASVFAIWAPRDTQQPTWRPLPLVGGPEPVGVHVPVNRLAERYRHHGFGFTDYPLVLSDRTGAEGEEPPPAAAWISADDVEADVVVVEDAVAWAWKGRALRGKVSVDTRMDLWRLLAHANVCIDLGPGPYIARECIEALRFGTPIVVPNQTGPAAFHAQASGGSTFSDPEDLLAAVSSMKDEAKRSEVSHAGRRYSDSQFGDPASLVARVRALLGEG
jgi:hypothetical protein